MRERERCVAGRLVGDALAELGHGETWLVDQISTVREARGLKRLGRATLWRWLVGEGAPKIDDAEIIADVLGSKADGTARVPVSAWSRYQSKDAVPS